ncbi:hypothetical protein [Staphylococcus haemolyticus]|nr:hypothetical protein [Staphylococcus haemolyticus]
MIRMGLVWWSGLSMFRGMIKDDGLLYLVGLLLGIGEGGMYG